MSALRELCVFHRIDFPYTLWCNTAYARSRVACVKPGLGVVRNFGCSPWDSHFTSAAPHAQKEYARA